MICGETFTELYRKSEEELREYDKRDLEELRSQLGHTLLTTAINRNDVGAVKKFLQLGLKQEVDKADIVATRSPLVMAIRAGNSECVRLLLEDDSSPMTFERYRESDFTGNPFAFFLRDPPERNDCEIARLLLRHGADFEKTDGNAYKNLATRPGTMKVLLDAGLEVNGNMHILSRVLPNKDQYACERRLAVCELLIEYGADLTQQWYLAWACLNNQLKVARLVLASSPASVLESHAPYVETSPALTKCFHPLCSLIYTMFEFQDDCLSCLELLMRANVQFEWDCAPEEPAPTSPMSTLHKTPFDQFHDIQIANSSFLATFRLLLKYGVSFCSIRPFLDETVAETLRGEGYMEVRRLQFIARDVIRKCLGPGINIELRVKSLPVTVIAKSILLLKGVLDLSSS